ncbi:MAG: hypothetical protein IKC24_07265, partial [Oscillospiraceae bacterium]|nr:hypothetical protein [Oscillospiraceae bacterium]
PLCKFLELAKSSKNFLFERCRTPFLGFPHTPFLPVESDKRVYRQSQTVSPKGETVLAQKGRICPTEGDKGRFRANVR